MLKRRYYPFGDSGDVRDYLNLLRADGRKKKAAVKLDVDIQTLEEFWPLSFNVSVRILRGWEPLWELRRSFDKIAYRIFFCLKNNEIWLLSSYEKKSQTTPRRELERAYRRMKEILETKQ